MKRTAISCKTFSDNFPFFMAGVPSIAMFAKENDRVPGRGFGHTVMDTLDKVSERDMKEHAMVAARVLLQLVQEEGPPLGRHRTPGEIKALLVAQELEQPLRAQDRWPFAVDAKSQARVGGDCAPVL